MNLVLQGRRQLLREGRRLGPYRTSNTPSLSFLFELKIYVLIDFLVFHISFFYFQLCKDNFKELFMKIFRCIVIEYFERKVKQSNIIKIEPLVVCVYIFYTWYINTNPKKDDFLFF